MGLLGRLQRKKAEPIVVEAGSEAPPSPNLNEKDFTVVENGLFSAEMAIDVMADAIYRTSWSHGWFEPPIHPDYWNDEVIFGVCILSNQNQPRSCPSDHPGFRTFEQAITALKARVALKLKCKAVDITVLNYIDINPDLYELHINADTRIQIVDTVAQLATARKNQYAAFVRDEGVLCVWADRVEDVVPNAKKLEEALIAFVWNTERNRTATLSKSPTMLSVTSSPSTPFPQGSTTDLQALEGSNDEKVRTAIDEDPEKTAALAERKARPVALVSAVISGLAAALGCVLSGLAIRALLIRFVYDGAYIHLALAVVVPFFFFLAAFPCNVIVTSLFSIIGPIAHVHRNSAFYSAIAPERTNVSTLYPITVQIPVYKEDLDDVIAPTVESVKRAVTTYERQGGSVNIIICDDGLQLLPNAEREARIKYYSDNNLGYTARPPHGQDGFLRRGRFKKAGNLNYCNRVSLRTEDLMKEIRSDVMERLGTSEIAWNELDEKVLYEEALGKAIEEDEGRTWAAGNIRIGEILLLIDSDTRVPEDCFMDASLEMWQSPQVAIIQHASGVMQVAHHFFENGMAFFTKLLQTSISFGVANGDVAPFVGHNAFLRWSALQECAMVDNYDGAKRVWSEEHVSEDFQIALNLQSNGWQLRWATYSNLKFEEGVSLTCADELSRWQKYSWGCSEIIFNPLIKWPTRSPFTKLFRTFLWSPIPPQAKWVILAYICSYYAIALAWSATLANFVIVAILKLEDAFYIPSWEVFLVCILIFQGLNNVSGTILRYRLKLEGAGKMALEQVKWLLFFTIFFSGLSLSCAQSLLCHLCSINMSWTSTSKSVEKSNFFLQLPKILKAFWIQITLSVIVLAGMIVSTTSLMPVDYRANGQVVAIVPLAFVYVGHLIWPFALDPYFTTFTF